MLATIWRCRDTYGIAHVDVFERFAFIWACAASLLLRSLGKPYVLTLRGGKLPNLARRWPWVLKRLLRSASAVTVPSGYYLQLMRSLRPDIRVVPNSIDLARYDFRLRDHPAPRLVWLRAFHDTYNPDLAAHVVALLAEEFPDVELVMVGPDKGDGSLARFRALAESLGVAGRIQFVGGVPKPTVSRWLNRGDIFLNTTNVDNTPVSVLEALACGLCVVSTNVGGVPYLLNHERDALLVPAGDAAAMAAAVRRLLVEPGLAAQISRAARARAAEMDWSHVGRMWEEMLTEILESSTAGASFSGRGKDG
jgi:glycosyltransferase involved in cell wall biosynthesis